MGTSSEDLGSSGIHFVFRHQYYHSIIISVSPNHIIIDLDLIRAPGFLWADSEARLDRQRLHFLNSSGWVTFQ